MATDDVLRHNQHVLDNLKPGDLVKFDRNVYRHWAVYIGNSEVIHRLGDRSYTCCRHFSAKSATSASGDVYEGVSIRQEKFFEVAGKNKAYIANDWDNRRKPLPPDMIIKNAKDKVGEVGYNFIFNNCEHFATTCRYGQARSRQVKDVFTNFIGLIVIAAFFLFIYLWMRLNISINPTSLLPWLNNSNHT